MIEYIWQQPIVFVENPETFLETLPVPFFRHSPHEVLGYDTVGIYYFIGGFGCTDDPVDIGTQLITQLIAASDAVPDVARLVADVHPITETLPMELFGDGKIGRGHV